ncbi:MAG: hypothetical protein QOI01_1397 [Mycobacterium sp.]|jgi:glyoxylase-like metal-dependent hydrolase (beta-lactamase superfamily II)|nr:hypothetical protein [Mycobacterium sp.]
MPEHGHTPGLTGDLIDSRGESLLLCGDIVHAAELQFKNRTVTIHYDVDPNEAVASRLPNLLIGRHRPILRPGAIRVLLSCR